MNGNEKRKMKTDWTHKHTQKLLRKRKERWKVWREVDIRKKLSHAQSKLMRQEEKPDQGCKTKEEEEMSKSKSREKWQRKRLRASRLTKKQRRGRRHRDEIGEARAAQQPECVCWGWTVTAGWYYTTGSRPCLSKRCPLHHVLRGRIDWIRFPQWWITSTDGSGAEPTPVTAPEWDIQCVTKRPWHPTPHHHHHVAYVGHIEWEWPHHTETAVITHLLWPDMMVEMLHV